MSVQAAGSYFWWYNRRGKSSTVDCSFSLKREFVMCYDVPFTNVDFSVDYSKPVQVLCIC